MAFWRKKQTTPALDDRFGHIAFIMDGNGRWAKRRGLPREFGHRAGAEAFHKVCCYCEEIGFKAVTVYAFSTENWKRPQPEVEAIMDLLEEYIDSCERDLRKHDVQFHFIGDRSVLRPVLQEKMKKLEDDSANCRMILNIAVNYGARSEICRAVELLRDKEGPIEETDLDRAMYTAHSGDPDMIVRTGGDLRISNFLLWQAAYSELYFTPILWPDFTPAQVDEAIRVFYSRQRRYGGI